MVQTTLQPAHVHGCLLKLRDFSRAVDAARPDRINWEELKERKELSERVLDQLFAHFQPEGNNRIFESCLINPRQDI